MGSLSGVNRVENVEYVERGGDRGPRPTVGAAVPCRPHGFNRVENVEYVEGCVLPVLLVPLVLLVPVVPHEAI